jgi:hypothetical protein
VTAALVEAPVIRQASAEGLRFDPPCDALLDGRNPCPGSGWAIVRFREHGDCKRDGKGLVICKPCLDWISRGDVMCSLCDAPLFIVATVKL